MGRQTVFTPYHAKRILNKSKRADHWFWTRYSASPYIGCQHGCEFCYCRERKYSPYEDPKDFAHIIKVKENAAELLRRELHTAPIDLIFTGDYQPAERKYRLSRKMLEVCYELGFPVFILERSPLVIQDIDLIQAIHQRARAVVAFSVISTPESPAEPRVRLIERLAPPSEKRFKAMEKIAAAGIPTGVCFMPILPGICDVPANIDGVVRWTAEHGGSFVLASSLTLADQQRDYFIRILSERYPDLLGTYQKLYPPESYAPSHYRWDQVAQRIRQACQQFGISDRMPRPIIPGDGRSANRRIVEVLANQVYSMEITGGLQSKIWAYRKAAWAIEDLPQDIRLVYSTMGVKGLENIPNIGPGLAGEIKTILEALNNQALIQM